MPRSTWKPTKNKTLFAGPWIGEFGWELFGWQAKLRWLRKYRYDEVFVHCKPGHEILYDDFAVVGGYPADDSNTQGVMGCDVLGPGQLPVSYSWAWSTPKNKRLGFFEQEWVKLGRNIEALGVDVLIHARKRTWHAEVNWHSASWVGLVDRLQSQGLKVAQIGLKHQTANLPCLDFREQPLENLVNVMASSKLCIGTSSGPMHLASLCGCPHLVLTDDDNIMRYTDHWNPFDTRVRFAGSWHPAIPHLHATACEMLNE